MDHNAEAELAEVIEGDFTVDDIVAGGEEPTFHTILEVWREVLKPAAEEAQKKVTPSWCSRIVAQYAEITYRQMPEFHYRFYAKIQQLLDILLLEIASGDNPLQFTTPAEDAEHNAHHYKNLLLQWQLAIMQWELDWDATDEYAGVELGVISEVHKMFFSQTGLTAYLDNIRFEFTEDDQLLLQAELEELREGAQ